jgi:hypothetical protein
MSKLIATTDRVMANKIVLSGASLEGPALTLVKDKAMNWALENPEITEYKGKTVDQQKVSRLLDQLSGPRIQDFLKTSGYPEAAAAEKEGLKIVLSTEDKPESRKLTIWSFGGRWFARDLTSKRGEIFRLDDQVKSVLPGPKNPFLKEGDGKPH